MFTSPGSSSHSARQTNILQGTDADTPNTKPPAAPLTDSVIANPRSLSPAEGDIGRTTVTPKSDAPAEGGTSSSAVFEEKLLAGNDEAPRNDHRNNAPAECDATSQKDKTSSRYSEARPPDDATSRDALLDLNEKPSEKMSHMRFIWPTSCSIPAGNRMTTEAKLDAEMQKLVSDFAKYVQPEYQG